MNRTQLDQAARWNGVLKAIKMHREMKGKYPGFPFHDIFMNVTGSDMQAEILAMVEEHAEKKLTENGVRESLHGVPLEAIEAHKVEVRLGIRLQYAEQKIKELERRLDTKINPNGKWWRK